ncbi:MAG: hexokinase family protein [Bacillota bacterium]|jgi:hexokinase
MERIRKKIDDFLTDHQMHYQQIDFTVNCRLFLEEMEKGLAGKDGSLKMIPTYIEPGGEIPREKPIIVVDAGGTNFRVALVSFDREKKPVIKKFKVFPMPGSTGEISKEDFFTSLARYTGEIINESDLIGFCFSYPTEILPDKDGRLICLTKELKVKDIEGELIGKNLLAALKKQGFNEEKKVVILNDTVATLLAGKTLSGERDFDSFIGFILGTGSNTCYIEENHNIGKIADLDPAKRMIINVESGSYGKAPRGVIDWEFDRSLKDPGHYLFEKMISGAYLGELILLTGKRAAASGIFSSGFSQSISDLAALKTIDVNDFFHYPPGSKNPLSRCLQNGSDEDALALYYLMDRIIERAAFLVAIKLSALMIKTGRGTDPRRPVCITADGTTFYRIKGLRDRVNYFLKKYLTDEKELYYEFVQVDNAPLIGAAIAGLTN